jgi:hypothetical protein
MLEPAAKTHDAIEPNAQRLGLVAFEFDRLWFVRIQDRHDARCVRKRRLIELRQPTDIAARRRMGCPPHGDANVANFRNPSRSTSRRCLPYVLIDVEKQIADRLIRRRDVRNRADNGSHA